MKKGEMIIDDFLAELREAAEMLKNEKKQHCVNFTTIGSESEKTNEIKATTENITVVTLSMAKNK